MRESRPQKALNRRKVRARAENPRIAAGSQQLIRQQADSNSIVTAAALGNRGPAIEEQTRIGAWGSQANLELTHVEIVKGSSPPKVEGNTILREQGVSRYAWGLAPTCRAQEV